MAIKRREKPLTPAEAIELTKQSFSRFWFNCPEPLLAGVKTETGVQAFPLDARMTDRPWLLFFVDPFSASSRESLMFAANWATRYETQRLGVMAILKLSYSFALDTAWGHKISQQMPGPIVTVMDQDALIHQAFKVDSTPRMVLLGQGQAILDKMGPLWFQGTEREIQAYLRKSDPGLPLFDPMTTPEEGIKDKFSADFKGLAADSTSFTFANDKTVSWGGQWNIEADRITTQDPAAFIKFEAPAKRVAVIAQAISERGESEMIVEAPREFPRDPIFDDDLKLDLQVLSNPLADALQKRRSSMKIDLPRAYHLFKALPITHRDLVLRFPGAEKNPVAVYGIRIAD